MNTKQLKQKILDLAIHGKLVTQDPNDEPASVLLERIRKEKERLIKEGKMKKSKPLPKIRKDEVPYDLPENWEWCRLDDLCEIITKGSSPKWQGIEYTDNNSQSILFVTSENVGTEKLLFDNEKYVEKRFNEIQPRSVLKQNDILTNIVGASIGRSCIYNLDYKNSNINQAVALIRLLCIESSKFIVKYLNSTIAYDLMLDKQVECARANISLSSLALFLIPLPPLAEQHRIIAAIESAFTVIDEIERNKSDLLSAVTTAKSKILSLAISGKLVPQDKSDEPASVLLERIRKEKERLVKEGKIKKSKPLPEMREDEVPFELPEGWKWCSLGELAHYKKGPFGSSITKAMFIPDSDTSVKVYEQKNAIYKNDSLGSYFISQSKFDELKGFEVFEDDIIVSCAGTIGETYVMPKGIRKGVINQALMKVSLYEKGITDFYLIYFDYMLKDLSRQESKGTAIKNIPPFDILKQFLFPLPPLAEQKRIVAAVEAAFEQLDGILEVLG